MRPDGERMLAHRLGTAGDLVGGLAFRTQRDEKAADLRGGRLAAHDRAHDLTRVAPREVVAVEKPLDCLLDHRRPRKFRANSLPSGVSTDSGWNWSPSTGSSRCRTAMISPSSERALTSNASGTTVAASEW